jgi:hypothetical protein
MSTDDASDGGPPRKRTTAKSDDATVERSRTSSSKKMKPPPSPQWYVVTTLGFFAVGVLVLLANYLVLPLTGGNASGLWLAVGLGLILVGFMMSTRLR